MSKEERKTIKSPVTLVCSIKKDEELIIKTNKESKTNIANTEQQSKSLSEKVRMVILSLSMVSKVTNHGCTELSFIAQHRFSFRGAMPGLCPGRISI
jgi:hypothetical protein